ncbi:type VI secretion system-associated FHA domain protein TagH [Undibacterium terreum]|uniref:Phosphopeptide-binding protein n=1 Tax=Undibacterium terreum TaxID=1224302 RepID=A0A916UMB2_9BURK|nr:type VI secretion system-associated FHA domain protein TagH [Undibacterium terreum]GGC78449.1 phosphopeptide-binding protein [Undibacterium terreum]
MPITLRVQTYRNEAFPQQVVKRFDQLGGAIGRAVGNDLVLEDPSKYISRVHAKIDFQDAVYYLTDVGSNPSLINDRPVGSGRQMPLSDGDRLNIGEYQLLVSVTPEAVPLPPSPLQEQTVAPISPAADVPVSIDDSLSGAKILDVGGGFDNASFDPLGVNLFDAPAQSLASYPPSKQSAVPAAEAFWIPEQQPATPAFRGAESDHISPEIQAFQMPAGTPFIPAAPAVPSSAMAIPDDYDPLADYLPPRLPTQQAAPIPPLAQVPPASAMLPPVIEPVPVPPPVFIPEPQPVAEAADPELQTKIDSAATMIPAAKTPPAPAPALPAEVASSAAAVASSAPAAPVAVPVRPVPAAAAAAAAAAPVASNDEVIQALLRGLGMPDLKTNRSAVELAELAGAMLREATNGTMGVLMARAMTKRESRLEMTMIASQANNPLKFFPDADSALTQMLSNSLAGYMTPVRSYANAYDDLKAHELAILAGMRAALSGVLQRFDPAAIEERLQVPTVMDKMLAANRKAKMWDRLVDLYKEISSEADDDFQRLFGEKFAIAYEEQIQRLRQGRR